MTLEQMRIERAFSMADIARALGVSALSVSRWENGQAKPSTGSVRALAALYGVSVKEILNAIEETQQKK